jgi:hypothetical protein
MRSHSELILRRQAGAELVEQIKQAQTIVLEAVNRDGTPHAVVMSLAGFAEAYNGPPMPMPAVKVRILSDAGMNALREQERLAAEDRKMRCGGSP